MRYAPTRFALAPALLAALLFSSPVAAQPGVLDEIDEVEVDQSLLADDDGLDDGGMATIAVVGVSSYSELMADIGYLGALGGMPQGGQMIEGLLAMATQGKGIVGLDKSKPMGMVLQTDGAQFVPLVCLPVDDLAALLDMLVGFQVLSQELGDGVYEITGPEQIVYAKQAGAWAYFGQSEDALESAPADPSGVLADLVDEYDLGARVLVKNVPEMFKQMAIGQLRAGFEAGLEQGADETDEDFAARSAMAQLQVDQIVDAINDLEELTVGWSVDRDNERTLIDLSATAVPGSNVAAQCEALRDSKTAFSGFYKEDASVRLRSSSNTPLDQIEAQAEQLKQAFAQIKGQMLQEIDDNDDFPNEGVRETVKAVLADFFEVAEATAFSGVTDMAMSADLSTEQFEVMAAGKIKKTDKVEAALRKLDTLAKEESDGKFPGMAWNAASHGGAALHTLTLPVVPSAPAAVRQMLGQSLELVVGIGEDVVYFAAGSDPMATLTAAIDASQAAGEAPSMPMELVVSLGDVMAVAKAIDDTENAAVTAMIADALAGAEGADNLRLTVEPLGAGARYRLEAEKGVLKAIVSPAISSLQAMMGGPPR